MSTIWALSAMFLLSLGLRCCCGTSLRPRPSPRSFHACVAGSVQQSQLTTAQALKQRVPYASACAQVQTALCADVSAESSSEDDAEAGKVVPQPQKPECEALAGLAPSRTHDHVVLTIQPTTAPPSPLNGLAARVRGTVGTVSVLAGDASAQ